jgi:hypothetical protein
MSSWVEAGAVGRLEAVEGEGLLQGGIVAGAGDDQIVVRGGCGHRGAQEAGANKTSQVVSRGGWEVVSRRRVVMKGGICLASSAVLLGEETP